MAAHEFYFSFDDLGGMAGVQKWMQFAARFRTELGRVMATRYSESMYLEDRIMNACAALESLDGVGRGNVDEKGVYLVDRLTECINVAGDPFKSLIVEDPRQWATRVKDCRHSLAHHLEAFRTNSTGVEHLLAEQLYWLFAMCSLRMVEAPQDVFASIAKHPQVRWLTGEATRAERHGGPAQP
ncbi:MAG: hypothetical protein EOO23_08815 [Comamonadaceae bacterium]|nr:MAG: hypothetical protein EOO23_08815 [Comamonadaceae bacterium]